MTHNNQASSLTIFFPCYNDAGTIGSLVVGALYTAQIYFDDYEVIVINDGSKDASKLILDELQKQYPQLKVIHHEKNLGYGSALISGFKAANKELIFYTDGDGQYDVFELPRLLQKFNSEIDLVNGYKIGRSDALYRILIGKAYHFFCKYLFGLKIRDTDCDFRLIRTSLIRKMNFQATSGEICVELLYQAQKLKARIIEVPVSHYHRVCGRSQFFKVRNIIKTLRGLFSLKHRLMTHGTS